MAAVEKKIAVVGAGIAGSAAAFYALLRGAKVTLIDPGPPSASTTWASGGMLVPLAEMLTGGLLELGLHCRDRYPSFIDQLNRVAQTSLHLGQGALTPLEPFANRAASSGYFEQLARRGQAVALVDQPAAHVGDILRNVTRAAWAPSDGWIDPRALLQALHTAIGRLGGTFVQERALEIATTGVILQSGSKILADHIVICAGHNSRQLDGVNWTRLGKITGERGIMLRLGDIPVPHAVIFDHGLDGVCYLVPEGNLVRVGSNTDPHNRSPTASVDEIQLLLQRAAKLWPVENARLVDVSVGFRPVGPLTSGDPFVGPLDQQRRVWGLLGLHRNGILFAPELARSLVEQIYHFSSPA